LGAIAHGQDELNGDEEDTGVAENQEEEFANAMAEGIEFFIGERASDEVER